MGTLGGWFLISSFCLFFFILLFTHIFIVAVFNVLKAFSTLLPTMSQGNSNAYRCPSKNKIFSHNFNLKNFLLFHNLLNRYFLVYIKKMVVALIHIFGLKSTVQNAWQIYHLCSSLSSIFVHFTNLVRNVFELFQLTHNSIFSS